MELYPTGKGCICNTCSVCSECKKSTVVNGRADNRDMRLMSQILGGYKTWCVDCLRKEGYLW